MKNLIPVAILAQCATIIDKSNWTKGALARTKTDKATCNIRRATTFCSLGHILKVSKSMNASAGDTEQAEELLLRAIRQEDCKIEDIAEFNDAETTTVHKVKKMFIKAVQLKMCPKGRHKV